MNDEAVAAVTVCQCRDVWRTNVGEHTVVDWTRFGMFHERMAVECPLYMANSKDAAKANQLLDALTHDEAPP